MPQRTQHNERRMRAFIAAMALTVAACSTPGVATPLPEPPSLDATKISAPGVMTALNPTPLDIRGSAGAAPSRATLRATNLDSTAPPVTTTADDQGAFLLTILVSSGNELRLQAIVGAARSAPLDFTYTQALAPSVRETCVTVSPGFELSFGAPGASRLTLANGCSGAITLSDPRLRLGLPDFQLRTALPLDVVSGASAGLDVAFQRADASEREDVLFVTLTVGGQTRRYPFTLFAPAP